ncbi:helix-turn-helix domain-containing protein [Mycolicibacterium fortuitum]|nr:helix-turn-helix domain-containing protein [Mycolicibacterium fortuitum]
MTVVPNFWYSASVTQRGVIPPAQRARLRAAAQGVDKGHQALLSAVREAKNAGGSIRAIAEELGKSPQTIQRWLTETQ